MSYPEGGVAPPRHATLPARPGETDIRAGGLMDRTDIEAVIVRYADRMEEATEEYARLCDESADAEADWKLALMREQLAVGTADDRPKDKETRDAKAHLAARSPETGAEITGTGEAVDLYRRFLIYDRRLAAAKVECTTLEKRLDAYRTLAANVRAQT